MDKRDDCKYGADCYQKNPAHKEKYRHPAREENSENVTQDPLEKASANGSSMTTTGTAATSPSSSSGNLDEMSKKRSPDKPLNEESKIKNSRISIMSSDKKQIDCPMMMDIYDERIEICEKREHAELLADPKLFIKYKFLVEMPEDFYNFWEFCQSLATDNEKPQNVLKKCGLQLVGPFDVLADKFKDAPRYFPGEYLRHWRFYYDTPEFQTIIVKEKSCLHYGYWRDQPDTKNCFIAKNDSVKGCEIELIESNVFSAVLKILDHDVDMTPFNRPIISKIKKALENWVQEKNIQLPKFEELSKRRNKDVVCKTFHKAGVVVPFDRDSEQGYRQLIESDAKLKKILSKFDDIPKDDKTQFDNAVASLQPFITAAYIAVDEMDFGTALELGIDLFCHGTSNLHDVLRPLLITGYTMSQRPQYIAIMKSHLEDRRTGYDLSVLTQ